MVRPTMEGHCNQEEQRAFRRPGGPGKAVDSKERGKSAAANRSESVTAAGNESEHGSGVAPSSTAWIADARCAVSRHESMRHGTGRTILGSTCDAACIQQAQDDTTHDWYGITSRSPVSDDSGVVNVPRV